MARFTETKEVKSLKEGTVKLPNNVEMFCGEGYPEYGTVKIGLGYMGGARNNTLFWTRDTVDSAIEALTEIRELMENGDG